MLIPYEKVKISSNGDFDRLSFFVGAASISS